MDSETSYFFLCTTDNVHQTETEIEHRIRQIPSNKAISLTSIRSQAPFIYGQENKLHIYILNILDYK